MMCFSDQEFQVCPSSKLTEQKFENIEKVSGDILLISEQIYMYFIYLTVYSSHDLILSGACFSLTLTKYNFVPM